MDSNSVIKSDKSNPFAFCFVEETGGTPDQRTRLTVRSHAAREVRRRRRVQQTCPRKSQEVPLAPKKLVSPELALDFLASGRSEFPESSTKRPRSNVRPFVSSNRVTGPDYGLEESYEIDAIDETVSEQALQRKSPSPFSTSISAVFDPFFSMVELSPVLSSSYSNDINLIKSHAIDFCFPGPTKSVVFPEAVRTPALLGSILYMAYANLSTVRGWNNPDLALALKTAAISHVNKKLSHPSTATCTNVIASIAYLSTGTWIFGDEPNETAAHLTGLRLMVQQRGMRSLGVYRFGQTIRKYLFIQHAVMQAMSAEPSDKTFHFDYELENGVLESTTSMPEGNPKFLCNIFMVLQNSEMPNEQTTSVLMSTKTLMDLVIGQYEDAQPDDDEAMFALQFRALKTQIQSNLSAYNPMCPCHNDFKYESVRLSCLIIVEAIETRKTLVQASQLIISCLSEALDKTDLSNSWGDMLGVLYWVAMIGAAAWRGRGGLGERMMDSTLGSSMFKATFENVDLGCAIRPARLFGRLQMALKRRCEMTV